MYDPNNLSRQKVYNLVAVFTIVIVASFAFMYRDKFMGSADERDNYGNNGSSGDYVPKPGDSCNVDDEPLTNYLDGKAGTAINIIPNNPDRITLSETWQKMVERAGKIDKTVELTESQRNTIQLYKALGQPIPKELGASIAESYFNSAFSYVLEPGREYAAQRVGEIASGLNSSGNLFDYEKKEHAIGDSDEIIKEKEDGQHEIDLTLRPTYKDENLGITIGAKYLMKSKSTLGSIGAYYGSCPQMNEGVVSGDAKSVIYLTSDWTFRREDGYEWSKIQVMHDREATSVSGWIGFPF